MSPGCDERGRGIHPAGPDREPVWPAGVVGAITHCDGYCAAAVARAGAVRALGIDAEQRAPLPAGVAQLVCTASEQEHLDRLGGDHWATVLFSPKESIYEAWFPIEGRCLNHQEAELSLDAGAGTFRARILAGSDEGGFPAELNGSFAIDAERIYTAVVLGGS